MAAALIDSIERPPTFEKFVAYETPLNDQLNTLRIEVFIQYQGSLRLRSSYIMPINQEDLDDPSFIYDDVQERKGYT